MRVGELRAQLDAFYQSSEVGIDAEAGTRLIVQQAQRMSDMCAEILADPHPDDEPYLPEVRQWQIACAHFLEQGEALQGEGAG